MSNDLVLLTIHSEHATRIYNGEKKAELRKSFSQNAPAVIFLYETSPIQAVTGAFISKEPIKAPIDELAKLAATLGVPEERAYAYFGKRASAWVIPVGAAFKFAEPVPIRELEQFSHKFRVPQVFAYISSYEALGRNLLNRLRKEMSSSLRLTKIRSAVSKAEFRELVMQSVGCSYDDINDDFVEDTLNPRESAEAAFSTENKEVFEIKCGEVQLGYTTLTSKTFGSVKTGPTVLSERFRGFGFGALARAAIMKFCQRRKARKIYCTCASNRPHVLSYLIRSGLNIEAQLSCHLSRERDEFVLGKIFKNDLVPYKEIEDLPRLNQRLLQRAALAKSGRQQEEKTFFRLAMKNWYFSMTAAEVTKVFLGWKRATADSSITAKPREIFSARINGELASLAIVTKKRSNMRKINFVAKFDSFPLAKAALTAAIEPFPETRRFYITIPQSRSRSILGALSVGFSFEGLLKNPFGGGDHVCLGLNRNRVADLKFSVSKRSRA